MVLHSAAPQRNCGKNGAGTVDAPCLQELLYELIDRKGEDAALNTLVAVAGLHRCVAAASLPIAAQ
jgi:hypothetical protein